MTLIYVGTYANQIYVYDLDPATGALSLVSSVAAEGGPSYLALGRGGRTIYSTNEQAQDPGVSAFALDPSAGQLTFINRVASGGADPAHLSVDPSGSWLLVANYTGGTIATFPIQSDGALGEASQVIQHSGSGPNQKRQQGPHPHMIVTDPHGGFVLVPDLGDDRIVAYRLDRKTGQLVAQPDGGGRLAAGAGPRHLVFAADGGRVYVINELASTLAFFTYDPANGRLVEAQVVPTLPEDFTGTNTTAAVAIAPSGRFVYGSNRGHDSVAAFAIDPTTGQLTPIGHTPTGGRKPRDINSDPTGTFLLAANQDSDSIVVFSIDPQTGQLQPTGHSTQVARPVRILFGT
jgi:6-phosphogluconolactonase